jgi:glycosyltransferase involved in cell wall biosynthesis
MSHQECQDSPQKLDERVSNLPSESEIIGHWKGNIDQPVVSICCITFNHESYVEDALKSFLMQETEFPFEILIHDDASSDRTSSIIQEYEAKYPEIIKPIYQKENQFSKGIHPNPTFNFSRAKGEFIALCEGDDFWISNDKLEKQVAALQENPECVLCFHDAKKIDDAGGVIGSMVPCKKRYLSRRELAKSPFTPTLTRMFRNVGFPWKNELNLPTAMDVCLAAYLSKFGGAVYLGSDVLAAYRVHEGGVWSLKNQYQKCRMTVDSSLYIASQFKYGSDVAGADDAFVYHMSSAAGTIFNQMSYLTVLKSVMSYLARRMFLSLKLGLKRSLLILSRKGGRK